LNAVVCAGCGCLCDDVGLILNGGQVIEAVNACDIGARWFRAESIEMDNAPSPFRVEDTAADFGEAVRKSAELLQGSRAPIIVGLTRTTIETVRVAAELADTIGAVIDPDSSLRSSTAIHAFQRQGKVTATLGEVKNRADVVVFWGVDPVTTHPRHAERYSIDAPGRFRPNGRADRTVIVVDEQPTPTSELSDRFVPIAAEQELAALWAMRAILLGKSLEADRVLASTGHSPEAWTSLVDRLKGAEYGAVFFEPTFGRSRRSSSAFEAMTKLVRELNRVARCVMLPLGAPGNGAGTQAVLSWRTGFPQAVVLDSGVPASIPGLTSASDRLLRREADLALIVADPIPPDLPSEAVEHLKAIPQIVISPATVAYDFEPTVRFSTGNPFLTSVGSVIRCDGVPLPVRAPLTANGPSDRDCLRAILSKLCESGRSSQIRA
jgi:formylmethanofuran dehydrogenase subunit B